ncbi:WD40-repeat-containing domain protein [Chytriomyces sp. MP71]|nr:WD40-repeat-containing domain protein [Chytriomyces sp. MP71]
MLPHIRSNGQTAQVQTADATSGAGVSATPATQSNVTSGHAYSTTGLPQVVDKKKAAARTANFNSDVQQYMNIQHFEQLQKIFEAHKNDDGSSGFDINKFREVFGKVLGGGLSYDQMTMLFMKIDANSDGTVDWDEFSTYMMAGAMGETENFMSVIDEKIRRLINGPHKDMIKKIDFVPKERKYITVSREGIVGLYGLNLKLQKTIDTKKFTPSMSWVADSLFMHDHGKLIIITDDRQLCIFDILSIKARLIACIAQLENSPLCLAYAPQYDDSGDLILFGDDGGYVNVLQITRKFLFDNSSDNDGCEQLTPAKLQRKDSLRKNSLSYYRRKIHNDWVLSVRYYQEMNGFVSCASENTKSLVIGDLERKTVRYIHVPKGIKCFDVCRRPSFLVTGGRDKIIRLWNPYVLSKPAGTLSGHNTAIVSLLVNHEESQLISLSEDKMIKIWNIRNLNCIQTLMDKVPHRPENIISAIFFDSTNRQLLTGSNKLETWPLYKNLRHTIARSHDFGVVSAMFNENFHQVVSGCQGGTVSIWDLASGDKIFQFHNAHGKLEITAMCFDKSGRRLVTGSRDGIVKMWNFNNGQILRKMMKTNSLEVTDGSNNYIIAVGWDRRITIFIDDSDHFETQPVRILNGAGWGAHRGHEDDISSVAFCSPNLLATSSVDGCIVIWNLESGYIKLTLREPFLDLRSKEEKVVEKMNCQITEEEGLTTMAMNPDNTLLLLAGSRGHLRVFEIKNFVLDGRRDPKTYESQIRMRTFWRAHVQSISSVNFVEQQDVILTASKDATVRVWTLDGAHIGIFGQDVPWIIDDPSTFMSLPLDVKKESALEKQHNQLITSHREFLKKDVIETWKHGIAKELKQEITQIDRVNLGTQIQNMRRKAIQVHIISKWKEECYLRKVAEDWTIDEKLVTVKNQKQFFSYDPSTRPTKNHLKSVGRVKHDAVFHLLTCHNLEEIPAFANPGPKLQKNKKGS